MKTAHSASVDAGEMNYASAKRVEPMGETSMAKRTKADVAVAMGVPMKTLNALLDYIKTEVAAGNEVQFTGFGAFKAVVSPEREVRVPSTGETKTAKAKFRPKFSAGTGFKEGVAAARKP